MKTLQEILDLTEMCVEKPMIVEWIEAGWLNPISKNSIYYFEEIDVARIQLIYELHYRIMVEPDTMPLVLSLLDQLYGTRAQLNKLVKAIEQQPESVKVDIFTLLETENKQ